MAPGDELIERRGMAHEGHVAHLLVLVQMLLRRFAGSERAPVSYHRRMLKP
jgi:hypothetical protein